jgi:hypothetical protein
VEAIGCFPSLTTITPLGNTGHRTLAGTENAVTSRDPRVLVEEAAEPVASLNAGVIVGWRGEGPSVRWFLAELRPAGVVVIDVFDEDVVEMSPARHEDAIGTLAPRAGDPPLADRVRPRRPSGWSLDGVTNQVIIPLSWASIGVGEGMEPS